MTDTTTDWPGRPGWCNNRTADFVIEKVEA